ncbi:transposase [Erythrobacter sp. QSSC1-22B]|uniref:transposase n=1 Tax=Erythrobacter sp. QSSC1-22B TaxID=1860125 RepID=UPI0009F2FCEE|nr:transposase [Erythrobacter sp. QSSC1-22B]
MSDSFGSLEAQSRRIEPHVPLSHRAVGNDRQIISGIIFVTRNELRWRDVP